MSNATKEENPAYKIGSRPFTPAQSAVEPFCASMSSGEQWLSFCHTWKCVPGEQREIANPPGHIRQRAQGNPLGLEPSKPYRIVCANGMPLIDWDVSNHTMRIWSNFGRWGFLAAMLHCRGFNHYAISPGGLEHLADDNPSGWDEKAPRFIAADYQEEPDKETWKARARSGSWTFEDITVAIHPLACNADGSGPYAGKTWGFVKTLYQDGKAKPKLASRRRVVATWSYDDPQSPIRLIEGLI